MNKSFFATRLGILWVLSLPLIAMAQSEIESEVLEVSQGGQQPIYIVNKNSAAAKNSQESAISQPTTVISAAPLGGSGADDARRTRQDMELQTELKIVEKLERSRLEDERRRAQRLFGNKLNPIDETDSEETENFDRSEREGKRPVQQQIIQVPVYQQPAPVINKIEIAKQEIQETSDEIKYYGAANFGFSQYPGVINVRSDMNYGAVLGMQQNKFRFEGLFNYGRLDLEDLRFGVARVLDVDQYMVGSNVKYVFGQGLFRPFVGGSLSYMYRNYTDRYYGADASSHAFDLGPVAGVEVEVMDELSVQMEAKYLFNLFNQTNSGPNITQSNLSQTLPFNGTPLEQISYYMLTFSVNYRF